MKLNAAHARDHFSCTRMRAVLTRSACARAHRIASITAPGRGHEAVTVAAHDRCRGCELGAAHRRGEAPVPAVTLVPLRTGKPVPKRWCLACGAVLSPERWRKSYCSLACYSDGRRLVAIERAAEVAL